jgi:uncharacterized iron-regulated protein
MKQLQRTLSLVVVTAVSCVGMPSSAKSQETHSQRSVASPGDSNAVVIEDVSQINTKPYVETLRTSGKPPMEYLVAKFKAHDLVLLGEEHGVRENCELVASVLEPLYRRAGVRVLATEFVRTSNSERVNRLVTGKAYDRDLSLAIMRDYAWPTWGYQEYMDILEAAWRLNASLPEDAEPLRIVPLDSDWSQHDLFFKHTSQRDRFDIMLERERHMVRTLDDQILTPGHKALVHLGYLHSIVSQGERVGTVLRKKHGDRVFQVCLHHRFSDPRSLSNVGKLIEKVVQESGDHPLGFDVVGTPFGHLHDPKNMAFTFGEKRTFDKLAEGYIVLKPVHKLHPVHWIDGFIVESNFKEALDVAEKMGQADPKRDDTPEKLDARLKKVIESR